MTGREDPITVLLVDDDASFAELVATVLEREDDAFEVTLEHRPEAALSRVGDAFGSVDCVVSDYQMPGMDGVELLRELRDEHPDLPFFLLTGRGSEEVASEAISAGVTDYFRKGPGTDRYRILARRIATVVRERRTESQLRERERQLATLMDNLSGVVYRCGVAEDWPVEFVSDGCRALTGHSAAAVEAGEVSLRDEVVHPGDRETVRRVLRDAVDDEGEYELVYRIRTADGDERWVLEQGQCVTREGGERVVEGLITDITDRRRLEEALQREQVFTRSALDSLQDLFYAFDADGTVLRWNDRCNEVTGYTDDEIASMEPTELFADQERVARAIDRVLDGEDVTVQADLVTKEGDRIPYELTGSLVDDPRDDRDVICGTGRDITPRLEYEQTLHALHESTRDLVRAETSDEVYATVVAVADDLLPTTAVTAYRFDDERRVLEPVARADDGSDATEPATVDDGGDTWDVFASGEPAYDPGTGDDGDDATGGDAPEESPEVCTRLRLPLGNHGVLVLGAAATDAFDATDRESAQILAANTRAALDRAEREQLLREREATVERHNERLRRLNQVNDIIRDVYRTVVGATTVDELEAAVCERLAAADPISFAWIGAYDDREATVVPETWRGADPEYTDHLAEHPAAPDRTLAVRAAESRAVEVVEDVLADGEWSARREAALAHDYQSVAAVPLVDGDRVRGVLVLYFVRGGTLGELERDVFQELGENVGSVARTIERRRALVADETVEIEVGISDPQLLFNRLSTEMGCRIEIEGYVPQADDTVLAFLTVDGAPATDPGEALRDSDAVAAVDLMTRGVDGGDDTALYELRLHPPAVVAVLLDADARLGSLTSADGETTLVAEFPRVVGVRSVIDRFEHHYDGVELRARREVSRDVRTPRTFAARIQDELTPRQYEVLQSAYFAGYFEWPRRSDGQTVAAALGVEPPTFHYHLRGAHRTLVSMVLDR